MSSSVVWVQVYDKDKPMGNISFIETASLDPPVIAALIKAAKAKLKKELHHAGLTEISVYPPKSSGDKEKPYGPEKEMKEVIAELEKKKTPPTSDDHPLIVVAPQVEEPGGSASPGRKREAPILSAPAPKKTRRLQDINIQDGQATTLCIGSERMLNPNKAEFIKYYGRPGMFQLFEKLVDDRAAADFFNVSLIGPPGSGKSNLVFAVAEHVAFTKKQNVLWVGRRVHEEKWQVKLFHAEDNETTTGGVLEEYEETDLSLKDILKLPVAHGVQVLVVDAPTRANSTSGGVGAAAFEWAGKVNRVNGRRVIHVSSLGSYAYRREIREQMNLEEMKIPLFTSDDCINSLEDLDLKKQVCGTLGIKDPNSVTNEEIVHQKFFYSGINARWFYNRSIDEIKQDCDDIMDRLDKNVTSMGPRDDRAVNSAVATVRGDRGVVNVYTSRYLAQTIGSSKGSYHSEFLKLFPFVEHTLGTGTPGDVFESDFRFHLEESHNLRDAQVAVMKDKAEEVMIYLGKSNGGGSRLRWPAGRLNSLPPPLADKTTYQQTGLDPKTVQKTPQWFIPESKTQPFLDFMALFPTTACSNTGAPTAAQKWQLKVIQNTTAGKHSTDIDQLRRVVDGLLMDGFTLEDTIIVVYVIENREKSGRVGDRLDRKLRSNTHAREFHVDVIHSVYPRLGTVPE